jgi:hypothetical protein
LQKGKSVAKKRKEEKPKEYTHRQLSHFKKQKRQQRIILISGIAIIAAIILIPVIGWFVSEFLPLHQTMLEVNGVKFNVAYYIDTMKIGRLNDATKDTGTLSNEALQYMMQGEIIKQGAAKLGITVSDNETKNYLKTLNLPDTKGFMGYYRNYLIASKLQNVYFGSKVPQQGTQVDALMMMLENDKQAQEIRDRLVRGDNFTALAGEFAQNYYSKSVNSGDFGWHIREVLKPQLGSDIPLDYAFSADVGSLSQPLSDNESYKQLGYWLIKVADRPEEGKVNVQALLVSDNVVAMDIKSKLEAGTVSLADMADKYTQYSLSKDKQGDLGVINATDNSTYTQAFNNYVFNPATVTGKWSDPILEKDLWTRGGSWLVKLVAREENRPVSDEDRNSLISDAFNNWYSELSSAPDLKVNSDLLTDTMRQWAMKRVDKVLPPTQVQPS